MRMIGNSQVSLVGIRYLDDSTSPMSGLFTDLPVSLIELDAQIRPILRHWGQQIGRLSDEDYRVDEKGVDDYVTSVDRALDRGLTDAFQAAFPQDGIVSEENAQSRGVFQQNYRRCWFIDPLDGTEAFIHHQPDYALMVGLLESWQPQGGWIYVPERDHLFFGGTGWGLFQTRGNYGIEPLAVREPLPPTSNFCPVVIGLRDDAHFGAAIAQHIPGVQLQSTVGSFGLKILEVIQGRAGLYVYLNRRVKLWDTTGPVALAQAAGLVCCDLEGRPLRFDPQAIDCETLTHYQSIVIGWPYYVEALREKIAIAYQYVKNR
jgi:3'(2'), 5'-bisphosphate nucleotidase